MLLDRLEVPIVLAPLAGGPSTPQLTAAVSHAGGLGVLASGYLSCEQTAAALEQTRALGAPTLGVNLFVPGDGPSEPASYAGYVDDLSAWASARGMQAGTPRYADDDWEQKLELLITDPVDVLTFTFGCPSRETQARLKEAGSETWVTVTSVAEAREALAAGADALVVQGAEAGGHRGSFHDRPDLPVDGLLALLQAIRANAPGAVLVASGGIASGAAVAAVLAAGARAAQIGTAFMLAPEAGTSAPHRRALASEAPTELTRAFTGRLARGIRNDFMIEHPNAPLAYPEIHYLTAPLRKQAREAGDAEAINLWAGEAHALAQELPAGEILARLAADARAAIAALRASF